ncbi:MAG: hypothetical protein B7Z44_04160 [Caulobacter sp. 12-67-6]|nr:MAG: hypothetical protein B7Z44_04160 [Caulobacter sp. 12-67-6]OYX69143.1 MAG: hypothetical protein B7Y81_14950 [Caulobacter sp. 32-67-35]
MTVSRPLLIGLIASATLNVFLVGGVVGALWVRQAPPAPSVQASAALPPAAPVVGSSPRPSAAPAQRPPPATSAPPSQGENLARPPLWMAGKGLSQESRRALRRTLREANQRNQPVTRQARAERQAALQALDAKPYDADEVAKRLSAARALDVQARGNVEAALARYAATLSPEERAVLTEGLRQIYTPRQASRRMDDE